MLAEAFVLLTLFTALVIYCVAGGADFGVGIVEMLSARNQRLKVRKLSEKAIAPIWEANHVWIVLIIVILFTGFPTVHTALATTMHVPFLIMLVGIVLRGTAFTFRYYDVNANLSSERLWTWLFRAGSVLVPISFGAIAAALHNGQIPATPTSVWASYFAPWISFFSLLAGIFAASLFAWLATVFLSSESVDSDDTQVWRTRAHRYGIVCFVVGAMTSLIALAEGALTIDVLTKPASIISVAIASASAGVVYRTVGKAVWLPRVAASLATAAILAGYWLAHYPIAIRRDGSNDILWHNAAAPPSSLRALSTALVVGLLLITPGLAALYRVFKSKDPATSLPHNPTS